MPVQFVVEAKGLPEAIAQLQGLSGKELARKTRTVVARGTRALLVPAIRAAAPTGRGKTGKYPHPPGTLAKKVGARQIRTRQGEIAAVSVGPKRGKNGAWWGGWVIRGTKPHDIKAKNAGSLFFNGSNITEVHHPGAKPNPFVNRGVEGRETSLAESIKRELLKEP